MTAPVGRAGRDRARRPARRRRRGRRRAAHVLGRPAARSSTATRADELCTSGRGQVLIPWPNRLEDGSYEFDGRSAPAPARRAGARTTRSTASSAGRRGRSAERAPRSRRDGARAPPAARLSVLRSRSSIEYALSDEGLSVHDDGDERRCRTRARTAAARIRTYGSAPRRVDSLILRGARADGARRRTSAGSRPAAAPVDGDGVRLPAAAADRRDDARQLPSPTSSATRTAAPASSSATRRAATRSRSGSTSATAT